MAAVEAGHMHCAAVLLEHGATSASEVPPAAVAAGQDPTAALLNGTAGLLELLTNEHVSKDPELQRSVGEAIRHVALKAQDAIEESKASPAQQAEQCQEILALLEAADAVPGARPIQAHVEKAGGVGQEKRLPVHAFGPELREMITIVQGTAQQCSPELRAVIKAFQGTDESPPETIDARLIEEMLNVVEFECEEVSPALEGRLTASAAGRAERRELQMELDLVRRAATEGQATLQREAQDHDSKSAQAGVLIYTLVASSLEDEVEDALSPRSRDVRRELQGLMEDYRTLRREVVSWIRVVAELTEWGLSDAGNVAFKAETMRCGEVQREMKRAHAEIYAILDRMCLLFGNKHRKAVTMESIAVELDSYSLESVTPCTQAEPVGGPSSGPERAPLFVDGVQRGGPGV